MRYLLSILLVLFALSLIGCSQQASTPAPTSTAAPPSAAPAPAPTGSYWTCSMHPQIHEAGPGKCPICGMDLIEKKP